MILSGVALFPAVAGTDAVSVEDIGETSDQVRNSPVDENTIVSGDEAMVDKVFIYLDGCPLVQVDGPTGVGEDAGLIVVGRKNRKRDCVASGDSSELQTENMKLLGSSVQGGLHVRLWRETNEVDDGQPERRLAQPQNQTMIVDITTIRETDPVMAGLERPEDPKPERRKKVPEFTIPEVAGEGGGDGVHLAGFGIFAGGPSSGSTGGGSSSGTSSGDSTGGGGSGGGGTETGGGTPTGGENYPPISGNPEKKPPTMYADDPLDNMPRVPLPAGISLLAGGLAALGSVAALKRRLRRRAEG